ncbi:MAG: hypothetical protein WD097_03215 [Balneolales bacterium]
MNVENFISVTRSVPNEENREQIRREKTATDFEELFARQLVGELIKDLFQSSDNSGGYGQSSTLYREFIKDVLSGELAAQRKLGMAEMVLKYRIEKSDIQEPIQRDAYPIRHEKQVQSKTGD